jgi:4-diphosphocytidyl-2-C-methyl-D-erythritol kinase
VSASLTAAAAAKINLFLHITGRRADGYHELESLIGFVGLADEVTLALDGPGRFPLTLDGPFAGAPGLAAADNLVVRAARALAATLEGAHRNAVGATIHLTKNIPVAAGLGGGSADAAAVLRALAKLWDVDERHLASIAPMLGADVPVCLTGQPMFVAGIGDVLAPVPRLPSVGVVLVNPGRAVATPAVFAGFDQGPGVLVGDRPIPQGPFKDAYALVEALKDTRNDLTAAAEKLVPEIQDVRTVLNQGRGCRLARMAGSGATCFGLFDDADMARAVAADIAKAHPHWWCWAGGFAV